MIVSRALQINRTIATLDNNVAQGLVSNLRAAEINRFCRQERLARYLGLDQVSVPKVRHSSIRLKQAQPRDGLNQASLGGGECFVHDVVRSFRIMSALPLTPLSAGKTVEMPVDSKMSEVWS